MNKIPVTDKEKKEFDISKFLENHFKSYGYSSVNPKGFDLYTKDNSDFPKVYSFGVQYPKTIYGSPSKYDVLYHPIKHKKGLVVETIWQAASGSADRKFPFMVMNIKEKYDRPTIIILDGGGYTQGAKEWLYNQVGENLIGVFSLEEFQEWSVINL